MDHRHLTKEEKKQLHRQHLQAMEDAIPPIEKELVFGKLKDLAIAVKKRGRWIFEEKLNYETYCRELQSIGYTQEQILAHVRQYTKQPKPLPSGPLPDDRRWVR